VAHGCVTSVTFVLTTIFKPVSRHYMPSTTWLLTCCHMGVSLRLSWRHQAVMFLLISSSVVHVELFRIMNFEIELRFFNQNLNQFRVFRGTEVLNW